MTSTYRLHHMTQLCSVAQDDKGIFVRLAETIFHPQGGGQPSDTGTIGAFHVTGVYVDMTDKTQINHYIEANNINVVPINTIVLCKVNVEKRANNATSHSMGHIIGMVLEEMGYTHPSGNHFPGQAKITEQLNGHSLPEKNTLENIVKQRLATIKNTSLLVEVSEDKQGMRFVKIGRDKKYPCGGTHLSDLTQLKSFNLRNIKMGKEKDTFNVGYDTIVDLELFKEKMSA